MSISRSAELVHIDLNRGRERLAAAWYPSADATGVALLHLHGKGGNFYTGPGLFIPGCDQQRTCAHLALNMRCHDLGYTRYDVPMPDAKEDHIEVAGGMWERLSEGYEDVLAAMAWLRQRGYPRVFLVGHSSGAYYGLEMSACADGDVAGVVLLSTVISYKRHLHSWFADGLDAAVARARDFVERGEGHRLLATESWYYAISARSLLERVEQPDDAFEQLLSRNPSPIMFVCGETEKRLEQWRSLYDGLDTRRKEWLVLPGVSHDYIGAEQALTSEILRFAREWA